MNYRPTSVVNTVSNLIERVVRTQLLKSLEPNSLLSPKIGFLWGGGILDSIVTVNERISFLRAKAVKKLCILDMLRNA